MKYKHLDKQIIDARNNYNYFAIKLFISILKSLFKLSFILLITSLINLNIIIIFQLIYTIYSFYDINNIINYYINIMKDIKTTINIEDKYLEIDLNLVQNILFNNNIR